METINYQQFSEKLSTVVEKIGNEQEPLYLELPNALRAVIMSEQDYSSLMETFYLLSNPINAEKLLTAASRSIDQATSWEQVKNNLGLCRKLF
ncbi:MAG: type II toxin-antitoxin system Phd/YefM family antitoxin [Synechocystis sp.]|nr:type II toxin-antitoxin system Phd/YefM family antitoxin [Synechocystis sp.]